MRCCWAGAITTLGRGGSDLTATCIAAALGVEEAQVWKDVDGEQPALILTSVGGVAWRAAGTLHVHLAAES